MTTSPPPETSGEQPETGCAAALQIGRQVTYNRCRMAVTKTMPHHAVFGCPDTTQHRPASRIRCHGLPACPVRGNNSMGPTAGRSPWMKEHVDQLRRLLADEHGISIHSRLLRAELAEYLTNFSTVFGASRLDARLSVTQDMLAASAREIADAHTALVRSVTR